MIAVTMIGRPNSLAVMNVMYALMHMKAAWPRENIPDRLVMMNTLMTHITEMQLFIIRPN